MKPLRSALLLIFLLFSLIDTSAQRTNLFQLQYDRREVDSLLILLSKTDDAQQKVLLYQAICWKLRNTNAEAKAIYYANKGIELARRIHYKKAEADITRFKGMITWNFKHQNITYDLYRASLKLSKEIGDKEGEAYCYDRLGVSEYYNERFDQSQLYLDKAISIFKEINSDEGLSYVYSHLNWLYSTEKKYGLAIEAGRKALEIRTRLNKEEGISNSLADMGITYKDINSDSSLFYITKAVELAEAKHMDLPLAEHTILLSELFMQAKDYTKALHYAKESYALATKNNSKRQIEKTTSIIAKIYEEQHNYEKALEFLHIYLQTKDSLFNEEINKKIVEQEMDYKYEKEKQAARDDAKLTRVVLIGVIILLVIGAVMSFLKYRFTQILKLENLRRKISSDLHDDIGATLSSINIYAELAKKTKENTDYIKTIQQHAINTVGNLDELVWSINPNNDNLKVLVERMRSYALPLLSDNNIKTEFSAEISDDELAINLEKRRNIYFAFKEMVANVLKHANSTCCTIKIRQHKSFMWIEIKDNGNGFDIEKINHQRNGLRNLKTRARENGGDFVIISEPGKGTTCEFRVMVKQKFNYSV